jgi:putative tryptophan/tyrosine transport system substrate-binding protein
MRSNYFIALVLTVIFTALLFCLSSCQKAPSPKKTYLIGIVNPNQGTQDLNRGFIEGLAEYGYIKGQNTTFITSTSSFELDQTIKDMVARNVDLIFAVTTPAARKAKDATQMKNIPVVFAMQDPVASGLIKNLANPGGNLTGIQIRGSIPKAVEWMLKISPGLKNIYVPIKFDTKAAQQSLEDLHDVAILHDLNFVQAEVNNQAELKTALADIPDNIDAIFVPHSIFINSNVDKLVQAAIDHKLLIGSAAAQSDLGVIISYGMIAEKTGKQVSQMAQLILSGRSPKEIPSEIADFFIGVNLKTAKAAGIEIPVAVLQQADIIIR